jgi:glutamine synthetase
MMDNLFKSLSAELQAQDISQVYLSFAQLSSLDCYHDNDFESHPVSPNDIIATQMKVFKDAQIAGTMDPELNYLRMLVDGFHKYGIKVNLAFGGGNAGAAEFTIAPDSGHKLADIVNNYGIDGVDFDIESVLPQDSVKALKAFFADFRKNAQGKHLTITVMMGIQDWPRGCLEELFTDFNELFDGVNLMAYSNSEYYLDAVNDSWGMTSWIDIVGKNNTHKISIGFFDRVPYEKAEPREKRGASAAYTYSKLVGDLHDLGYPANFRAPFWWPAEDVEYHHYDHAKDGSVQFISADQTNFYEALRVNY